MEITRHYFRLSIFFLLTIFFLHPLMVCLTINAHTNITTDKYALLSLKSKFYLDSHSILASNWSVNSTSPCNWVGVTCGSRHNRVTVLDLSNMSLVGELTPHLGNLSFLVSLNLSQNNFHNSFPRELTQLRRLKVFNCSINDFSGNIPSWLGLLPNLRFLYLQNNNISGFLSTSLFNLSKLEVLNLADNSLEGRVPSEIGNLLKLKWLNLNYNYFSGSFPLGILNFSMLETLSLSANSLSGDLPIDLGSFLPRLQNFEISRNKFGGEIPSGLSKCALLQTMYLYYNNFSGHIPKEFGNLTKLEELYLDGNQLTGAIPKEICALSSLSELDLSKNRLYGTIPKEIGNLSALEILYIGHNNFGGALPMEIGNLTALDVLYVENNNLEGVIPKEFGNLITLEFLSMGYNNFGGAFPMVICSLPSLLYLYLYNNLFTGAIPKEIGNLTTLELISIGSNNFGGVIPQELGKLHMLKDIAMTYINVNGTIPEGIFNISSLKFIAFSGNNLVGRLPTGIGYGLKYLEEFYLISNFLSGVIPDSISNCSGLSIISFSDNQFSGALPTFLGNLRLLERLYLDGNTLTNSAASRELSIINSLAQCNYLREVDLDDNPLHATLPALSSVGNLSTSLEVFSVAGCGLKGIIPNQFGNLSRVIYLSLQRNSFTGFIPQVLGRVHMVQGLYLDNNKLSGPIPHTLCGLQYLYQLGLSSNQLSGSLPKCFGNSTSLRNLYLDSNRLSSEIPSSLCSLRDLLELDLSFNLLEGFLPIAVEGFKALYSLDLSYNEISGKIPVTIGQLQNMKHLSLAHNRLEGHIVEKISQMVSLEFLDLSLNKLSGSIPMSLEGLEYLKYFNVSFNELSGEIPSGGCFKNFTSASFMFNEGLCGIPKFNVSACHSAHHSRIRKGLLVSLTSLGAALIVTLVIIALIIARKPKKSEVPSVMDIRIPLAEIRVSYYELSRATCGFSQSNLIGSGSFGTVYKGILDDGMPVAVKVFNHSEDALKSFDVECDVLKNLRHRNLTKVITGCFTDNFKALVLEYFSNGSFDQWLHSKSDSLDFVQRLNILIDVAFALEYLHHGYPTPVVHCDLKPANVLLDEEMIAHVSDFSVTKLLTKEESFTQTETLATLGYMAPEYGSTGMVSTQCDTYSFGIMIMETFSNKKPTDESFNEYMSLRSWISDSLPNQILQVVDPNLLRVEDRDFTAKLQCVSSILELALQCAMESPEMRLNMKDVVARLNKIKLQFLRGDDHKA
ncbi:probable LRR receptor-like serine/threonine-protein kinase At3g47570 [Ipomoea triloba]|uniref:probable LRR receptor-like serine/threonine-protein kinase At3g47570 n=1 Tax=Ipomoea triloba TaxID=35885 RepID=UPI00125E3F1B|nr:probable LRR receptor-like serine/threonine-protein kinase At3g47570 [Ipomoea triloba]